MTLKASQRSPARVVFTHQDPTLDADHQPEPNRHGIRGKYQNCRACGQPTNREEKR